MNDDVALDWQPGHAAQLHATSCPPVDCQRVVQLLHSAVLHSRVSKLDCLSVKLLVWLLQQQCAAR